MSARWIVLFTVLAGAGCGREQESRAGGDGTPSCEDPAVLDVVNRFGRAMGRVSLLAPDTVVRRELRDAYAPVVTEDLLDEWLANPATAPGRLVSSPWPDRIEAGAAEAGEAGACVVRGDVIHVTSADAPGAVADRQAVTLTLRRNGEWRIGGYDAATASPQDPAPDSSPPRDTDDIASARDVLRRYYAAIGAREFAQARALWSNGGAASGQTLDEFAAGFAQTASVRVLVGTPDRVEGAAGSRYIRVPATILATTTAGDSQRFDGTYTLRRSVVDGATAEQRAWRIYSADLVRRR